jgi:hypothetical protein
MALLLIADGAARTVSLGHKPPYTLEEVGILIGAEVIEAHRINHPNFCWMLMDENAKIAKEKKTTNVPATHLWAKENGIPPRMVKMEHLILGDVLLCTAEEFVG